MRSGPLRLRDQECALARDAIRVAAERTAPADDPVTRDEDRHRVWRPPMTPAFRRTVIDQREGSELVPIGHELIDVVCNCFVKASILNAKSFDTLFIDEFEGNAHRSLQIMPIKAQQRGHKIGQPRWRFHQRRLHWMSCAPVDCRNDVKDGRAYGA